MKLISVRITNYKLIEDSGEFSVRRLNCLVGKNESGKTATLQALYRLNPIYSAGFDLTADYPRNKLTGYQQKIKQGAKHDNVLLTKWELDKSEVKSLTDMFGIDILNSNIVEIKRSYENQSHWVFDIDHKKLVDKLLSDSNLFAEEKKALEDVATTHKLIENLSSISTPSETQEQFLAYLNEKFPEGTATDKVRELFEPHLPKFVYFSNYSRMPGIVSLDLLTPKVAKNNLNENERVFVALLESVNTTVLELQNTPKFEELKASLEGISNDISNKIFSYWSQNPNLEVQFSLDQARQQDDPPFNSGQIFRTRIRNTRHKVTVPFDERSTGFVWFFSFLIWFSQVKINYGENLIILLDEPGLSLHARAQEDLLRYIHDELVPNHQVFYTTHSPFMVDQDLDNVRTVEDVITKDGKLLGTKIGDDVLSTDEDTLFPLQAALGYDITQTLFIGKNTLLVEGPSDLLYLKWFSNQLRKQGKQSLDKRWVITPMGGIDKVSSFVALFKGNKLNTVVLTDYHTSDKKKIENLKALKILKESALFTADSYCGKTEADIEDLIGENAYKELVNFSYALTASNKVKRNKGTPSTKRVIEEVEDHFRTLPADVEEFDHYSPAEFLTGNTDEMLKKLPELDAAFEKFEQLFNDLNTHLNN